MKQISLNRGTADPNVPLLPALLIIIALITGCSIEKQPLNIGFLATLSGKEGIDGQSTRNGVAMAVEEFNETGGIKGRKINLFIRDDGNDSVKLNRSASELIEKGVSIIIGPTFSSMTMELLPLAKEKKILLVSPTAASSTLSGLDDNLIRLSVSVDKRAMLLAKMAANRISLKKIAAVYDISNENYSGSFLRNFRNEFKRLGGSCTPFPFDPSKSTPLSIAGEILPTDAEGILLIVSPIHGALICQHLRKENAHLTILDSSWASTAPSFIKNGGQAVEGVTTIMQFNGETTSNAFLAFKNKYENLFGEPVSQDALFGYESAHLIFSALKENSNVETLRETILKKSSFQGVDTPIVIDRFGDPLRTLYVAEVRNGRLSFTGTIK